MGILTSLCKSRDKPQNRTAGSAYTFYMGGTTSGKTVTERSAMQMTAVYSCVRILAEAVAGLPLHLYRYKEDGSKEKAIDHPLYRLLHDEPNPEMLIWITVQKSLRRRRWKAVCNYPKQGDSQVDGATIRQSRVCKKML